ncbi:hypothetical protein O3G_MSEX014186 [Manduca sexta]|uniref:Uncharacterized protein n=1 Tax=Manduca sexta TaxID=7130 RepID=A0A922CXY9_MANSE|nr:hypothetical protein O3G_MSEX014186 [Manduca sexta]
MSFMCQQLVSLLFILFIFFIVKADSLLCYNGTFTHRKFGEDPLFMNSVFISNRRLAKIRCFLTILCPENAMCFVRSWSARANHAWMVQRGCYQPIKNDFLPRTMTIPTRAMTCRNERRPEAEYKVCLCTANWCNTASCDFSKCLKYVYFCLESILMYITYLIL